MCIIRHDLIRYHHHYHPPHHNHYCVIIFLDFFTVSVFFLAYATRQKV